jgi:hypothetical protein
VIDRRPVSSTRERKAFIGLTDGRRTSDVPTNLIHLTVRRTILTWGSAHTPAWAIS